MSAHFILQKPSLIKIPKVSSTKATKGNVVHVAWDFGRKVLINEKRSSGRFSLGAWANADPAFWKLGGAVHKSNAKKGLTNGDF